MWFFHSKQFSISTARARGGWWYLRLIAETVFNCTIEFFTLGFSDAFLSEYLADLRLHRAKKISSKSALSGVWTHDLLIISLMLWRPSWVTIWSWVWIIKAFIKSWSIYSRNKQSPTSEVVHEAKESSLQKSPTDSPIAQLAEHGTDDLEVVSPNPTEGNFWQNLFCVVYLYICQIIWQKCVWKAYREKLKSLFKIKLFRLISVYVITKFTHLCHTSCHYLLAYLIMDSILKSSFLNDLSFKDKHFPKIRAQ